MTENEKNRVEGGTLYLVGTPIGNMADLSDRAKKVLAEVDFVAAEDTRNSGLLLSRIGVKRPMASYHEHNKRDSGEAIVRRLAAGEACALVTDAGMPAISDPGEDLVRLCGERGVPVCAIPGPSAVVTALAVSGLSTRRFVFEGFLPQKASERREVLDGLAAERRTIVLYEAPHRLRETLGELFEALGDRRIAVCRELTKINEEVLRCTLREAIAHFAAVEPRGEFVLVVSGANGERSVDFPADPAEHVAFYERAGLERKDAIKAAAKDRGLAKGEFYKMLVDGAKE